MTIPVGGYPTLSAALADGLLHYWPMDETSGVAAADLCSALDGVAVGANPSASVDPAGRFGRYARHIHPTTGAQGISITTEIAESGEPTYPAWTIAFWVRPETAALSTHFWWESEDLQRKIEIRRTTQQAISVIARDPDNGQSTAGSASSSVPNNAWALIVLRCDGDNYIELFINGTHASTLYRAPSFSPTSGTMRFGQALWLGSPDLVMEGRIDELSIWGRRLDDTDVARLWDSGNGIEFLVSDTPTVGMQIAATIAPPAGELKFYPDWTALLDPLQTQIIYTAVLTGSQNGLDDLPLAISSWQSTVQAGRSDYLNVVVPGLTTDLMDAISARPDGEIVVYRGARFEDGTVQTVELSRAAFQSAAFDRGPGRFTATLSGYRAVVYGDLGTRTLFGVRSMSVSSGGMRVRCAIDWRLRPGMTAIAAGQSLNVAYINYYVNRTDAYMDVGERA